MLTARHDCHRQSVPAILGRPISELALSGHAGQFKSRLCAAHTCDVSEKSRLLKLVAKVRPNEEHCFGGAAAMHLRVIALQRACVMGWSSACTPRDCASPQYLPGPCKPKHGVMGRVAQGRGRGRLGYVLLAALGMVLLAPFYGGMWLYYMHAKCGPGRTALVIVTCF